MCFENGSCLPAKFSANTNRAAQRVFAFRGSSCGHPGVPPTIGQKMARSLECYVSGLIAGLQPSKSDFRSFSKLLPGQFLLQIKLFRGPKLPKQHFKAQKSKIELRMSKNGFRLDASDREKIALRTAPASLQNLRRFQTGRHSDFCQDNFCSKSSFLVKQFEANTCSARRIAARPTRPIKEGWPPDRRLTFCWGSPANRSGQWLTEAGKHIACRNLKQAPAG